MMIAKMPAFFIVDDFGQLGASVNIRLLIYLRHYTWIDKLNRSV